MQTQELRDPRQEDQPADRAGGTHAQRADERLPRIGAASRRLEGTEAVNHLARTAVGRLACLGQAQVARGAVEQCGP
jgi:hypothetical protein